MAQAQVVLKRRRFGETRRRGVWWVQPLLVFLCLSAFIVYATWAAFQGNYFEIRRDRAHFDKRPRSRALPVSLLCSADLRSPKPARLVPHRQCKMPGH